LAQLEHGAATHVGRRPNNEDAYCARPELGLYAVADGIGGYEGGEVASKIALDTLAEFIGHGRRELDLRAAADGTERVARGEELLVEGTRLAHEHIAARQVGELEIMGSTLAAVLIPDGAAIVCNVGDSRVYLLRAGQLKQLTRDHTLWTEILARGVQLPKEQRAIYANELTRALGIDGSAEPEITRVTIRIGDQFLLCTDGLYESLSEEQMINALQARPAQQACDQLVHQAYEQGAVDNMTALIVRVVYE
jgi:serine/threonine protein phosphatase PrpC